MRLDDLPPRCSVRGVRPDDPVTVVSVQWFGSEAVELTCKTLAGSVTCRALKKALRELCGANHRPDALIRIACQELEAWYLGEPDALAEAFERDALRNLGRRARFRDSDAVVRPSDALEQLVPEFQKVSGARRMARHLSRERNRSTSFQMLMEGIAAVAGDLATDNTGGDQ